MKYLALNWKCRSVLGPRRRCQVINCKRRMFCVLILPYLPIALLNRQLILCNSKQHNQRVEVDRLHQNEPFAECLCIVEEVK